jgi:hypothetical protein
LVFSSRRGKAKASSRMILPSIVGMDFEFC